EAREVADARRLDDAVEEAVDTERAVVEPPRASEKDGRVVAGERGELSAVRALVEREEDQGQARVVAARLEQGSETARPVGRHRDVPAEVTAEARGERRVVVAEAADVQLHDETVVEAHARELVQHVRFEAARVRR